MSQLLRRNIFQTSKDINQSNPEQTSILNSDKDQGELRELHREATEDRSEVTDSVSSDFPSNVLTVHQELQGKETHEHTCATCLPPKQV